ncbi:hypothetical protein HU200_029401 [Digitaria exilis]|uniref:Bifunctional inhibitor/plant lipid transfer protein/seed storage helical domain-containing protein n=1 Tax=Digitaria exilis TaxID=1010633 RepID=A0A835BTY3_9POAL|nr:hypothetical protein HU200_029401 [Digitaria exilis]
MKHQTVAVLLLIVVSALVSPHLVIGVKRPRCTVEDKNNVLAHCGHYTIRGHPKEIPPKHSSCCKAAEGHDMQCIVDLLNVTERKNHDQRAIIDLETACN